MSKITRWRRGLWAAGQWWSYSWPWTVGSGTIRLQFQTTQTFILILLLLLALASAVIRPPYDFPTQLSTSQSHKYHSIDRRSLSASRYRPPSFSRTTHCFFNHLCSCKVLLRKSGHGESTSVDDFGNVDYYDGFPVRDLVNGNSPLYSSISSSNEESTEAYRGQFGTISTGPSILSDRVTSSTENANKFNSTSHSRVSTLSSEFLPHPSRLKVTGRGSRRGRGRTRGSFFERIGRNVQDVSCVGVPFTTIPGRILVFILYT